MFRYSKKKWGYLLAAVLMAGTVPNMHAAAEETVSTEMAAEVQTERKLCEEDEYIILSSTENKNIVYNCYGDRIGVFNGYLSEYSPAIYPKNALITGVNDNTYEIISLENLEVLNTFPMDGTFISYAEDVYLITEAGGRMTLWNRDGALLYETTVSFSPDSWGYTCYLYPTGGGYLIISEGEDDGYGCWVSADGQETKEITDPFLQNTIRNNPYGISMFGEYLYVYDYEGEENQVMDLDGTVYFSDITDTLWSNATGTEYYRYDSLQNGIEYLVRMVDGCYLFYNRQLNLVAQIPFEEVPSGEYGGGFVNYGNGVIRNFSMPNLGNRICTGAVWDAAARRYRAIAQEGNMYYLYDEETGLRVYPLYNNEEPEKINSRYLMTRETDGDYQTVYRLRDRGTGAVVMETERTSDDHYFWYDLQENSILYYYYTDGENGSVIYNNDLQETYASENSYVYIWNSGYYTMTRGIYNGIADMNGNWILKTTYYEE